MAFRAGVTPLEAAFFRAAFAFAVLLLLAVMTDRPVLSIRRSDLGLFALYGLVSIAAFFFLYLFAISRTSVATAAILLYTAPAFVIIISVGAFREPVTGMKAVAVALAFTGCVLVVRGYDPRSLRLNLPGALAGLASGLTYALYSIFGKTALRQYRPVTTLVYALGFGTLFLGVIALPTGAVRWTHSAVGWAAIIYLAMITTLLAQWLYLTGLDQVEAGRASLVATLEPVVAALLGYLVLNERLEGLQILGGLLVLMAVLTVRRRPGAHIAGR